MSMVRQAAKVNALTCIAVNEICYRSPFTLDALTNTARNRRRQSFRRSKRDAIVNHVIAGAWKDPAITEATLHDYLMPAVKHLEGVYLCSRVECCPTVKPTIA